MRPHGRAGISSRNPRAFGICDRCGFLYNHHALSWQYDYAGAGLINKRMLVCNPCNDRPQAQLRAIVLPADPTPIQNPRIQDYVAASTSYRQTSGQNTTDPVTGLPVIKGDIRSTQNNDARVSQEVGPPTGYDPNAIMPLSGTVQYGVQLAVLSIMSSNSYTIQVTCSSPHGLTTNDQVAVEGVSDPAVSGFYSVTVISTMAFTYDVVSLMPTQSFLQPSTVVKTILIGVPYNFNVIPQTGIGPVPLASTTINWINNNSDVITWINNSNNPVGWTNLT